MKELVLQKGMHSVNVSVNAMDERTHNATRDAGYLNIAIEALLLRVFFLNAEFRIPSGQNRDEVE